MLLAFVDRARTVVRVKRIRRTGLFLAILWLVGCSSPLVKSADLNKINEEWGKQQFRALEDIRSPILSLDEEEAVLFKKGAQLKVWVEGAEDWVRVKAYPAAETREETRGRVIIYIFNDDLKAADRKPDRIQSILRNKFNRLLAQS